MHFSTDDLRAATDAGLITRAQLAAVLSFFAGRADAETVRSPSDNRRGTAKFDVVHLFWYAGALIVISAMGLFSTLAFSQMGGTALTATALIYAALFTVAGHYLWFNRDLRTPGGLLIAVAVSMAPLAVYGVMDALDWPTRFGKPGTVHDFYTLIKGSWLFMEIATIAAAALALRIYRFPFIVMIAAIALWFMSMDIVPWIAGQPSGDWELSRHVSIWFGLGMIISAVVVNMRQRTGDFAYWLYLFGVIALWGGVTAGSSDSNLEKAVYCLMNVLFLGIAVFLGRRVFALFGTIGIAIYLGDLASKLFSDSLLFPFALSLIGVAIIALGLLYHRHQDAISARLADWLPPALKQLRPSNAVAA